MYRRLLPVLIEGVLVLTGLHAARADEPVSFSKHIAPILLDHCYACHGPKKAEGGYRVDSYERAIAAGDSATEGFVAEDLDGSEAFRRIVSDDEAERMPLEGDPLPAEQVELLKRWIEEGIAFDGSDPAVDIAKLVPPPVYPAGPETYEYALPVSALAFSPDGSKLLAAGYHELTIWNTADGTLAGRIGNVGPRTMAIAFSPDGQLLAVGGGAPGKLGETRLFRFPSGELQGVLGSTSDIVLDVAFSPDGTRLATGGADSVIRVFEVATGNEQLTITSHSDWIMALAWNADGTKLASGSRDKTAKVYDASTGDLLVTYSGHGQIVKGVAFHPEGADAYSSGGDNKIHRWVIADGKKSAEAALGGEVHKLLLAGDHLFTSSADKTVRQYESKTLKEVRAFPAHQDWAIATAYHAGTQRLASGSFDGEVRIWNVETGEQAVAFFAAPGYHPPSAQ